MKEVFKNIERHLKNISISLRVMECRGQSSPVIPISLRKLKDCYDFGEIDIAGNDLQEYNDKFLKQWYDTTSGFGVEKEQPVPAPPRKSLWRRWVDYWRGNEWNVSWAVLMVFIASVAFVFVCMGITVLIKG